MSPPNWHVLQSLFSNRSFSFIWLWRDSSYQPPSPLLLWAIHIYINGCIFHGKTLFQIESLWNYLKNLGWLFSCPILTLLWSDSEYGFISAWPRGFDLWSPATFLYRPVRSLCLWSFADGGYQRQKRLHPETAFNRYIWLPTLVFAVIAAQFFLARWSVGQSTNRISTDSRTACIYFFMVVAFTLLTEELTFRVRDVGVISFLSRTTANRQLCFSSYRVCFLHWSFSRTLQQSMPVWDWVWSGLCEPKKVFTVFLLHALNT